MRRTKSGFTLAEVLITVAILVVLAAVAVPSVIALRNNLNMAELNACAREIFLSAQHSLTQRKAAGTVANLSGGTENGDIYTLLSSDHSADQLLPQGSLDASVAGGYYVLRFNRQAAVMVEVFYSKESFTTEELTAINNGSLSGSDSTAAQARREAGIGYYRGDATVTGGVTQLLSPQISIVNDNDLMVTVKVPEYLIQIKNYGATLTLRVEEIDAPEHYCTISDLETECVTGSGTVNVTLDSLTVRGNAFKSVCSNITPGANITVTATLSASSQPGVSYISASMSASCSSLFERRATVDGKDTVYISNARHLQNLNAGFSGLDVSGTIYVEQTRDITWPDITLPGDVKLEYQSISDYYQKIAGFNGSKLGIRNLHGANGLFYYVDSCELKNIYIVDPSITVSDGFASVGALAGTATNCTIDGCRVYSSDNHNHYGITNSAAGAVGGLVGHGGNVTVTNSFSALHHITGGSPIGGLVGSLDEGSISRSYAVVEQMSGEPDKAAMLVGNTRDTDVTIQNCYAVGNIAITSDAATVSGFANGGAVITDSYCAVTYNKADGTSTGVQPAYGFAPGGDNSCAYRAGSFTPENSDTAEAKDHTALTTWGGTGWVKLNAANSHPYLDELSGKAYPFPAISGLPHYGSWPMQVQNTNSIKLYDGKAAGSRELSVILVPTNGTAEFWAEVRSGDRPAMVEPEVGRINGTVLDGVSGGAYDSASGRKQVTVIAARNPGVTYVDVSSGGATLRVVVVVYDVSITLTGNSSISNDVQSTWITGQGRTDGKMILKPGDTTKNGTFTADIQVLPDETTVAARLNELRDAQTTLSASMTDFQNWMDLKNGDPTVTANGNGILESSKEGDTLKVTGAASGTAIVSARWAMDESVQAQCQVLMEGAKAFIQAVLAEGKNGTLAEASNYPYHLDIPAEPGENVSLTFTAKLYGSKVANGHTYEWTVYKVDKATSTETALIQPNQMNGLNSEKSQVSCPLEGNTGWNDYRVMLVYTNDTTGERAVDYMTFSIYCAAKKQDATSYGSILIQKSDGHGILSGNQSAATVEQINGSDPEYAHTAELTLQGYVDGAVNTRVKWSYSTDSGANWTLITGKLGSIPIYDGTNRMRATVQWNNDALEYAGRVTGGGISIVGLDVNEYDDPFEFQLRAEAAEATEGSTTAAAKAVTVKVMPKLKINPENVTKRSVNGKADAVVTFSANRTDATYSYIWYVNNSHLTEETKSSIDVGKAFGVHNIELHYGPYVARASLNYINIKSWDSAVDFNVKTTINWDVTVGEGNDERQIKLIEKGTTEELVYSWGTTMMKHAWITSHPQNNNGGFDISPISGNSDAVRIGEYKYSVTGTAFSKDQLQLLRWIMKLWGWGTEDTIDHYLAIIGMDLKQGGKTVSDSTSAIEIIPGQGQSLGEATVELTADWSFPAELRNNGTAPKITWTIDNPELIVFVDSDQESASAAGEQVTIRAKRYSAAGYSATVTAKCTVECVNGREYVFTKHVSVAVPPQAKLETVILPCTADDVDALNQAFGDAGLTKSSLLTAVDEFGTPTLVWDPDFGCSTMYLKVRAEDVQAVAGGDPQLQTTLDSDPGNVTFEDLTQYYINPMIDRSYVDMDFVNSPDGKTMYIRLKAKAYNASVYPLELKLAIGSAKEKRLQINLYEKPVITMKLENGTDVTNSSRPVYLNDTSLPFTLTAALTPRLYNAADAGHTPLDDLSWELQCPGGYHAASYLNLTEGSAGKWTVSLKNTEFMPDFRVIVYTRSQCSGKADAGYSLVFLPENKP